MLLPIICIILICSLWILLKPKTNPNDPPVIPGSLPLIGNTHQFMGDAMYFYTYLKKLAYECTDAGGVLTGKIVTQKMYVITDPETFFKITNECLEKGSMYALGRRWLGNGLITAPLPTWKIHRKLLNPAFNQTILDGFLDIFNLQARRLVKDMSVNVGKGPFNHWEYILQNTGQTISYTMFGIDHEDKNVVTSNYFHAVDQMLLLLTERFLKVCWQNDFLYKWSLLKKKEDKLLEIVHGTCDKVFEKRKAAYMKRKNEKVEDNNTTGTKLKPFMDLLLELFFEKGLLSDKDIKDHINTTITAGYDTTSNVLVCTLLLVGSHPHVQDKIYEELQDVIGPEDRDVTKQDLAKLVYLEAILKESMRLYPVAIILSRYIDKNLQLRNYTLSKGCYCLLSVYGLHRHPIWGSDAEDFKPERWLNKATLPKNFDAFASFGAGRRICPGQSYAYTVMKIILAHFFRWYKVKGDHTKMKGTLNVMFRPVSGYYISLEDRYPKN